MQVGWERWVTIEMFFFCIFLSPKIDAFVYAYSSVASVLPVEKVNQLLSPLALNLVNLKLFLP